MASSTEGIIDQMYNIPDQQQDQALKEKAGKASKMIWVTFRKEDIHKYPCLGQPSKSVRTHRDTRWGRRVLGRTSPCGLGHPAAKSG